VTYVFRFPKDTPELTYDALHSYIGKGNGASRMIGTTMEAIDYTGSIFGDMVALKLYSTTIARIYRDAVTFPSHGDTHQATREWLIRIISDNGLGYTAFRLRGRRGQPGTMVINGDPERPVEGRSYPVTQRRELAPSGISGAS
jgi:hypothetical protein